MAGTALDWKTAKIAQNAGQLWRGLAIPGAGARLTLFSDGTPDATANPNAKHLGATKAGAKLMVKSSLTKFYVDEFRGATVTNLDAVEMGISAELVGVTDMELLAWLLPGVGTRATASGYDEVSIGSKAIVYDSIALIFPLIEDPTKFGVFHIYSGLNDAGVEWAQARKEMGFTPLSIVGYEVTSRAAGDTLGKVWKQI
jgi:hypothetical protein